MITFSKIIYIYIYGFKENILEVTLFLIELELICLHTVKLFQVFLSNINNSI